MNRYLIAIGAEVVVCFALGFLYGAGRFRSRVVGPMLLGALCGSMVFNTALAWAP